MARTDPCFQSLFMYLFLFTVCHWSCLELPSQPKHPVLLNGCLLELPDPRRCGGHLSCSLLLWFSFWLFNQQLPNIKYLEVEAAVFLFLFFAAGFFFFCCLSFLAENMTTIRCPNPVLPYLLSLAAAPCNFHQVSSLMDKDMLFLGLLFA